MYYYVFQDSKLWLRSDFIFLFLAQVGETQEWPILIKYRINPLQKLGFDLVQ